MEQQRITRKVMRVMRAGFDGQYCHVWLSCGHTADYEPMPHLPTIEQLDTFLQGLIGFPGELYCETCERAAIPFSGLVVPNLVEKG